MGRLISYNIEEDYDGENVYKFLREKAKISYRLLKSLKQIPNGIMLNGEHIRTVDIIHSGDVLSVDIPCPESEIEPVEMPLEILYEDSDLLIINKDPFIACHPTHNHQGDTLANAVAYYLKSKNKNSVFRAVGRLDKGTSGIVICALNKHCAAMIPGNVEKEYLLFSQADENARIMAANRVFAALDKEEFTDSLTIFPADANLDFVNYNTYYWMGE